MSQLYIKVETEQDTFSVDTDATYPRIALEAPASQGKANAELTQRLGQRLGEDVAIVSGHKSRRKKIQVDLPKEEVLQRLD
ncbi:MAG: DUF167 domain-containing protein [Candidatus Nanohaloarchaea archaeon]|nr:DUF167 domain-containing protein [Candidatus Nanohaloarchaea archaeon]